MKKTMISLLVAVCATTGAWAQGPTTSGITWNTGTNSGTFSMPAYNVEVSTELWYKLSAEETLDKNMADYGSKTDFFLDRTLKAGVWNTFASPFAIAYDDMATYFGTGAKVRQLDDTSIEEGNILSLNFIAATSIEAGKPYLVKPTANVDFSADGKEFAGVDLNAASESADNTKYVDFVPTLGKTTVTGNADDILIMTTEGTLVHPEAVGDMKGFRGYFVMHDAPAGVKARSFVINFGDGEQATGIISISADAPATQQTGIFDLQGRKVVQPTQKGIYIQNGKKIIIK